MKLMQFQVKKVSARILSLGEAPQVAGLPPEVHLAARAQGEQHLLDVDSGLTGFAALRPEKVPRPLQRLKGANLVV